MRKLHKLVLGTAFFLVAGAVVANQVIAFYAQRGPQPTPRQIHSVNAFLYAESTGLDEVREAWEQTALYDSVVESGLYDLLERVIVFAEQKDESGIVTKVKDGLEQVTREGLSFSVSVDEQSPVPIPYAALALHGMRKWEGDIEQIANMAIQEMDLEFKRETKEGISYLRTVIPQSPGIEVGLIGLGQHMVIVAGFDACNQTIQTALQPNLSIEENPKWKAEIAKDTSYAVETRVWFDFAPLKKIYGGFELPLPLEKPLTIGKILKVARLEPFDSAYMQQGYDGLAVRCESRVHYPDANVDPTDYEFALNELPPLPADLTFLHACSFDLNVMYNNLHAIADDVLDLANDQDDVEQIREVLNHLDELAGFDIQKELLDPIGSLCVVYTEPDTSVLGMNLTVAIELFDAPQLQTFLKEMMQKFYDLDDEGLTEDWPIIPIETNKNDGKMIVFEVGGYEDPYQYGALQIVDNYLVISLLPQSIDTFQLALEGEIPTFEFDTQSKSILSKLPQKFCSFSYLDTKPYITAGYGFLTLMAPMLQKAVLDEVDLDEEQELPFYVEDLPPAKLITRKLFPNISVSTYDQTGMKSYSYQSIPGFPMVMSTNGNPAGGIAAAGVGTALILPAIQQARTAARRAQGKNQLKHIGLALHNYHDTFQSFPAASTNNETPKQGLSWMYELLPFVEQVALYNQIKPQAKQPWGSEEIQTFTRTLVPTYVHPSEPWPEDLDDYPITSFVGIGGVGEDAPFLPNGHPKAGVFGFNRKTRLRHIADGASNTFMVGTVNFNNGPWARGGNATVRAFTQKPYINGDDGFGYPGYGEGFMTVLMADGSIRDVYEYVSDEIIEAAATAAGGEVIDWTEF